MHSKHGPLRGPCTAHIADVQAISLRNLGTLNRSALSHSLAISISSSCSSICTFPHLSPTALATSRATIAAMDATKMGGDVRQLPITLEAWKRRNLPSSSAGQVYTDDGVHVASAFSSQPGMHGDASPRGHVYTPSASLQPSRDFQEDD